MPLQLQLVLIRLLIIFIEGLASGTLILVTPLHHGLSVVAVQELLHGVEVHVQAVVGHVERREGERLLRNASLQRHLGVVEEPVLRVKADVVETLHESYIGANVEL